MWALFTNVQVDHRRIREENQKNMICWVFWNAVYSAASWKNVWYLNSGSPSSSQILKVASSVTLCQNECLHSWIQAEDIASHAEEEDPITRPPPHPRQYVFKPFCIRILLLLLLRGRLPPTPLLWASLVTGATGHGVAFPQKSSALNKSPNIDGDFISFSACGQL